MDHSQASTGPDPIKRPRVPAWSLFQIRDYRYLWSSAALNNTCMFMDVVVLALLVLKLTDSAWWVALVGSLRFMPWLIFGIFAGLIADRVNRWRVMVASRSINVLVMIVLLVLLVTDWLQLWHLLITTLVLGWAFVTDVPSRHSFIYDLVGQQNVVRAMSLETITFTIGTIVGPLMAGLLIEVADFTGAYLFLMSVYVLAVFTIIRVKSRISRSSTGQQPLLQSFAGGLRYSLQNSTIRGVLIITLIMNFMGFSAMQMFPVVAKDHLEVGPGLTGILISAHGIGSLLGASLMVYIGATRYHGRIFALGSSLYLAGLLFFALSPWYPLSFVMLMVVGLGTAGFGTMQSTIILISATPERRGMALGVLGLCIGVGPLGMIQMGAVASLLNPQVAIGISAVTGLFLMVLVIMLTPLVWRPTATGTDSLESSEDSATGSSVPELTQGDGGGGSPQEGLPQA
ncbi:MAG: MFS transporter [Dehalococcoidia bacterium]|nr:MFS transporter [Dehalococcoidia bacterium]